jgi:hypothetical protein
MSTKGAALFALIAMILWTLRMTVSLIKDLSGLAGGFVSLSVTVVSLIDFLAALSLLIFFAVYWSKA